MNDVENDTPDSPLVDFPPLLDWDEVLQDEREDRLGFARRTTYALLTLLGAGLVEGLAGSNHPRLEGRGGLSRCSRRICGRCSTSRRLPRCGWRRSPRRWQ